MGQCVTCGIEISDKAKTCSPRCRVAANRKASVTANASVTAEIRASVTFSFTTPYYRRPDHLGYDAELAAKHKVPRKALYWYDVPIAAVPVLQAGWPEMPEYMNGREYFLWWKNDFKVEGGKPVILDVVTKPLYNV